MNDDQTKKNLNHTPVHHLINDANSPDDTSKQTMRITKEGEPMKISPEVVAPEEIELTESEPKIEDEEVEKYVEVSQEVPSIHPDLKKAGLKTVSSDSLDLKHKIQLPISDDKILFGLHQPITTSIRWLAEMALFTLKHAHLTIKKIHGHVVRVMSR